MGSKIRLTKGRVSDADQGILWDMEVPGFGVKVGSQSKTFHFNYRNAAKRERRISIGRFPAMTVEQARDRARECAVAVADGNDPLEEREAAAHAGMTVTEAFDSYRQLHLPKLRERSRGEVERIFRSDVQPALGRLALADVQRVHLMSLVDKKATTAPGMAAVLFRNLNAFLNWCENRGYIAHNPMPKGRNVIKQPAARERVLDDDELLKIWNAAEGLSTLWRGLTRLLILTAQRRSEVSGMQWQEVDLDAGTWKIPANRTKNNKEHMVRLHPLAISELKRLGRGDQGLIFSTTGRTPLSGFSRFKRRLDALSDVKDWRLHDLRRTAASGMARLGVPPQHIEASINHLTGTVSGLAKIYNRHDYRKEAGRALLQWGDHVGVLVGETRNAVIQLRSDAV